MSELKYFAAPVIFLFLFFNGIISCSSQTLRIQDKDEALKKIHFDLDMLNEEGLYGPPDGLVSLDYKFCIQLNDETKKEVTQIDSTLNFHKGTGLTEGCSGEEYLCIGNTHQKNFKEVLLMLASLDYVKSIDQMFWEK